MKKLFLSFSLITIILFSSCKKDVYVECGVCSGKGKYTTTIKCDECKGKGQTRCTYSEEYVEQGSLFSLLSGSKSRETYSCNSGYLHAENYDIFNMNGDPCPRCNGSGYVDCWKCDGYGTISKEKSCTYCGGTGTVKVKKWIWETW